MRVLLPASPGVVVVPDAPTTPLPARVRRGRVLVMDDEEPLRRNVAYAIEQLGCAVATAAEGGEAAARWAAAREAGEPFDLAVLDLTVREGAGGLEALRRIRERDPGAKAVLMSGFTDSDALKDPAAHGFAGSLRKPFGLAELRALLARCLPG